MKFPEAKKNRAWAKQERRLHDQGVTQVAGSGSGVDKGDNRGKEFLVQCKTTYTSKKTISTKEWHKTVKDARKEDRLPVIQLQLEDSEKLAVLDWEDFLAILEQAGMEI